jgi:urea transport system permease protein
MKNCWAGAPVRCSALLLVVFPLTLDMFRLNLVGKYLTYAFVAVGLVLCWGYGGMLSLGQGVFFGLGGYAWRCSSSSSLRPISTKIQSTPGIPDFMDWNQITAAGCGSRSTACLHDAGGAAGAHVLAF